MTRSHPHRGALVSAVVGLCVATQVPGPAWANSKKSRPAARAEEKELTHEELGVRKKVYESARKFGLSQTR